MGSLLVMPIRGRNPLSSFSGCGKDNRRILPPNYRGTQEVIAEPYLTSKLDGPLNGVLHFWVLHVQLHTGA